MRKLIKQLAPKYRMTDPRNWTSFYFRFELSPLQEYCLNRNAKLQFQDSYTWLPNFFFPAHSLIFWLHQDTTESCYYLCIIFPPRSNARPHFARDSFFVHSKLSSIPLHNLLSIYPLENKQTNKQLLTLHLLHASTWEANCNWRLELHNHRWAHFKVIIRNHWHHPESYYILFFHLPGQLFHTFSSPFSLSADDPSCFTEKTEAIRWEHVCLLTTSPNLWDLCWSCLLSYCCGGMATLHWSPSLPIFSGIWSQQFCALFPAPSKLPFPQNHSWLNTCFCCC